jgi:hypothetical protein
LPSGQAWSFGFGHLVNEGSKKPLMFYLLGEYPKANASTFPA